MTHHERQPHELSPDDERLLDALVECGFDPAALEALGESEHRRVDAMVNLLELLDDYPVDDADDTLVDATLARIERFEDERAARLAFATAAAESEDLPGGRRFRLPDFISVAAVILIGASVIWPVTTHLRQRSIDAGCANNLRWLAIALGQYANDHDGTLPIARAGMFEHWSKLNHNVINLGPLIEGGYCELGHLKCPGHEGRAGESYSYQWQVPGHRVVWGVGRITLVLGDRNPLIDAARSDERIPALSISLNHGGRGQNALATDGATIWLEQPIIGNNDNIWLPKGATFLRPGYQPTDPADVFLAH